MVLVAIFFSPPHTLNITDTDIMGNGDEESATANLPPFNPVSMRLLDVLSKEDAVAEEVAGLLRLDAGFVGDILRRANTPVFGFQDQIRGLAHAIVLLGTRRLKALIATAALARGSRISETLAEFWRHSAASAFVAAELAECYGVSAEEVYTHAMLHDMRAWSTLAGCCVPGWQMPEGYAQVIKWACHLSDALGFHFAPQPAENGTAEEIPDELHKIVRSRVDPRLLTQAIQEKLTEIRN